MVTPTDVEPLAPDSMTTLTWADLCALVGELPHWVPRIALAETVCRELLILAGESAGSRPASLVVAAPCSPPVTR